MKASLLQKLPPRFGPSTQNGKAKRKNLTILVRFLSKVKAGYVKNFDLASYGDGWQGSTEGVIKY
jgi:hypothetical protein